MSITNIDFLKPESDSDDMNFEKFSKKYNVDICKSEDVNFGHVTYRFYYNDIQVAWYYQVQRRDLMDCNNPRLLELMICEKAEMYLEGLKEV